MAWLPKAGSPSSGGVPSEATPKEGFEYKWLIWEVTQGNLGREAGKSDKEGMKP